MVQVECPSCAKSYQVPEEKLGSRAKCKSCDQTFTLSIAAGETHSSQVDSPSNPPSASFVNLNNGLTSTPDRVAHYVLKRKLGAGAMGDVWLAEDSVLERDVAVKLIAGAIARDPERRKRFLREAKLAAKLSHPNVVTVYQAGIESDSVFVVMELVDGESLDKTVATKGRLDWREATRVICDAARGLAAAHELGLVHRDIKPANLMRTTKGVAKVVDFGLAREILSDTQLTREGMLLGTPAYMAPEQWTVGKADARSDLYSLIGTYYFLLTGRLPFDAPSLPSLGYQHRYEPFPDPSQLVPDLPPDISRLVSRGSQKKPADRYQDATELIVALETLLKVTNETGTLASGPNPPPIIVTQRRNIHSRVAARCQSLWSNIPPRWRWLAISGFVIPLLAVLGVVILVRTQEGTIQFELNDPQADVEFKIDGKIVEAWKNGKPMRFRAGEHQLRVTGEDFETVAETFTVKRGDNPIYHVRLVPTNTKNAATAAGATPTPKTIVTPVSPAPERGTASTTKPTQSPTSATEAPTTTSTASKNTVLNSIGMKLALIPAGEFLMGAPDSDSEAGSDEKPQHRVQITKPFYIGIYEVTQAEYERVMGTNPSSFSTAKDGQDKSQHPVEQVSWEDAVEFCRKLSELPEEKSAGRVYFLPTEAEWEYACRAGSRTKFSFGDSESQFGEYAFYGSNSESSTHPIGQKKPNAWGLYDMHGNVWEWCQDWYGNYAGAATDPQGSESGSGRVHRGGSWHNTAGYCRSAYRDRYNPSHRYYYLGFRVASVPSGK